MDDLTVIARILLQIEQTGNGIVQTAADMRALSAVSDTTNGHLQTSAAEMEALNGQGTRLAAAVDEDAISLGALGTAAEGTAVKTVVAGDAVAATGDKAALSAVKWNDLKLAYLGAGVASERNVAGLLALGGGAVSAEVAVAALVGGLAIFAAKTASDVNTAFQLIQGNTMVTDRELQYMREHTLQLANDSSKSWSDISQAYEHAANEGFHLAAATTVVVAGLKGAEATGASVSDTVNSLAETMHDLHDPASKATQDLVDIMEAAAKGNIRMPELVHDFTLVASTGAAMHQPLSELSALYATLTEATGSASRSQQQEVNMLARIISPTKQAHEELVKLSRVTGIDLVQANKDAADGHLKLSQYMELVRIATQGNNQALMTLFGGIRGGVGALEALGSGWDTYKQALDRTNVSQADANTKLNELAGKAEGQYSAQIAHLGNQVVGLANDFGHVLLPELGQAAHGLSEWINLVENTAGAVGHLRDSFNAWQDEQTGKLSKMTSDLTGHGQAVDFVATRYGLMRVAGEQVASSTGHVDASQVSLKDHLLATALEQEHSSNASASLEERYRLQATSIDHLTSSYDRLIAASKAYTASVASQNAPGEAAATAQLQAAIAPLAPDFQSALQPVLDGFLSKLHTEHEDYLGKVKDQDASYQSKLTSLHDAFLQKSATASGDKLAKETAAYNDSVSKLRAEHDRHLADLQRSFLTHAQSIEAAMKSASAPGAIFGSLQTQVDKLAQTDLQALSYALLTGKLSVEQYTAAAIKGAQDKQQVADIETAAGLKVALGMGDLSTAISDLQKQLTEAQDRVAAAIDKGESSSKIDQLVAAAAKLEGSHNHLASSEEQAALRIARASGDYAGYLQALQAQQQKTVNQDVGKYISDQQAGKTDLLPGDKEAITQAEDRLKRLSREIADLEGKSKVLAASFQDLADKADKRLKAAMDALELALSESGGKITPVVEKLAVAAEHAQTQVDHYAAIQKEAADLVKSSVSDVVARIDGLKTSLSDKLTKAIDQGAEDILQHGKITATDREAILRRSDADNKLTSALAGAEAVAKRITPTFQSVDDSAKSVAAKGLDALALAMLRHSRNIGLLSDRAVQDALVQQNVDQVLVDAELRVAKSLGDFGALLDATNKKITELTNKAAGQLFFGQENAPGTETQGQVARDRVGEARGTPITRETGYQQTIDQLVAAERAHLKQEQDLAKVQETVYLRTGEFGNALKIVSDQIGTEVSNAVGETTLSLLGLGPSAQQAGKDLIKAATDNERYTAAANQATAQWTQAQINAALAANDFATAVPLEIQQAGKNLTDSLDVIAQKEHDHATVTQADIDAARANQAAVDAWTEAQWEAKFATADLATQTQMLVQRFQSLISNASTVSSAQSSVNNAQLGVIAANSTLQVEQLSELITATQDESAVISAESAVSQAAGAGMLAAIKDQGAIQSASLAIQQATSPAALKVAQDQLRIAQDQMALDEMTAAWQAIVAQDQVKIALDKMKADAADAAEKTTLDQDQLAIAEDQVALAEDQLQLTMDTLVVQASIYTALTGVNDFQSMIEGDLSAINTDQQQIASDQNKLAQDQAQAAQVAAQGQLQVALDQQKLAQDQASAAAATQQGQIQIALDQQQLTQDKAAQQQQADAYATQIAQLEGVAIQLQGQRDLLQYSTTLTASQISVQQAQYDAQIAQVKEQEAQLKLQEDQTLGAASAQLQSDQNAILQASYDVQKAQLAATQKAAQSLIASLEYENKLLRDALGLINRGSAAGPHWVGTSPSSRQNFDAFMSSAGADFAASPGV